MAYAVPIEETVRALEKRIQVLEKALGLSGGKIVLRTDASQIRISPHSILLESSGDIHIKASGDVVIKGQRILQN